MLTHDHFLKQIQTTPDDPLPRRIYADWLEEQGDLRCELIRLEIERGQLEPWSDRYAVAQARLRELRPQIDADWLTALTSTTTCLPSALYSLSLDGQAKSMMAVRAAPLAEMLRSRISVVWPFMAATARRISRWRGSRTH